MFILNGEEFGAGSGRDPDNGGWQRWWEFMFVCYLADAANKLGIAADSASDAVLAKAAAEAAAAVAANYGAALHGTSTTSVTPGLGAKAFVTQANKQWAVGTRLRAASDDASMIVEGPVASYVGTALTITVDKAQGAGAHADWNISLAGEVGATGAAGTDEIRATITGNKTFGSADKRKIFDITAVSSPTLDFASVGVLTDGWTAKVRNSSTVHATVNGTDGLTSFRMYPGEYREFACNGVDITSKVLRAFYLTMTSSDTWVKPPGYPLFGGLGWPGAPSGARSGSNSVAVSGPGGSACMPFLLPASALAATVAVTIGAGGVAFTGTGAGNAGNATSFGSHWTVYPGGRGSPSANAGGGGGGGLLSAGGDGSSGVPGTAGDGSGTTSANIGAKAPGGVYGGGGGAPHGADAGDSVYGTGGGGGIHGTGTIRAPGRSVFGGQAGAAGDSTSGTAGTAPGAPGGSTRTGTQAGPGARGELQIWGVV